MRANEVQKRADAVLAMLDNTKRKTKQKIQFNFAKVDFDFSYKNSSLTWETSSRIATLRCALGAAVAVPFGRDDLSIWVNFSITNQIDKR